MEGFIHATEYWKYIAIYVYITGTHIRECSEFQKRLNSELLTVKTTGTFEVGLNLFIYLKQEKRICLNELLRRANMKPHTNHRQSLYIVGTKCTLHERSS